MHRIFVKVTFGSMPAEKRGRKQEWAEGEGNSDAGPILDNPLRSPRLATAIQIVPIILLHSSAIEYGLS